VSAARLALGVDLGGTKIEAAALDAEGRTRWRRRVATPQGDYAATLAAIRTLVRAAEAETGVRGMTVGIGTPGSATDRGLIRNANSTCLNGRPLQADLEQRLERPLRLANDADCLALSEATDGAAAGADVVFAVILGTGVGGGIAVHGRLLAGANGLAGEWGHNPLPWADDGEQREAPACWCGRRGCVETWLSGPALARDHASATASETVQPAAGGGVCASACGDAAHRPSAAQIAARAAGGDAACRASLRRHEDRLARALAAVVNLLDPDVIVLGGGLSRLDGLYEHVPPAWPRHVFGAQAGQALRTRLVRSLHGDASGVRGAAWLWRGTATG
jgi:fructokinase